MSALLDPEIDFCGLTPAAHLGGIDWMRVLCSGFRRE